MKIQSLFIPYEKVSLVKEISDSQIIENQLTGENEFLIRESLLIRILKELGALELKEKATLPVASEEKASKNEFAEENSENELLTPDNQLFEPTLPEALLEIKKKSGENILRAIMEWKNQSLKEVAQRYGGSSAQANISNFLSRPDRELAQMRRSTALKLSQAFDVPPEILLRYLGIGLG